MSHAQTARDRVMAHADYLDRQGQQTLAHDVRFLLNSLESITVLAEAHVRGDASVSPEAIALAGRKFLTAPSKRKHRRYEDIVAAGGVADGS